MSRNMREGIYITFNRVIYNNVVFGYDNHYYKCNEISCLDSKTKQEKEEEEEEKKRIEGRKKGRQKGRKEERMEGRGRGGKLEGVDGGRKRIFFFS